MVSTREIRMGQSNEYDERYCHELEWNECNPATEHRCTDGQCVDNPQNSDALAMICSETFSNIYSYFSHCFQEYRINCEIQRCSPLYFSCGDDYCYDGPSQGKRSCPTQRDQRYMQHMPTTSSVILFSHDNLTSNCFVFKILTNRSYDYVDEMMIDLKRLLHSCSLLPWEYDHPNARCSMFQCNDRSKCLSFHRLSDGEDEHQLDVCSRNYPIDLFVIMEQNVYHTYCSWMRRLKLIIHIYISDIFVCLSLD